MISLLQESDQNYYASQILHGSFKNRRRYIKKKSVHSKSSSCKLNKFKNRYSVKNSDYYSSMTSSSTSIFNTLSRVSSLISDEDSFISNPYEKIGTFLAQYKTNENYKFLQMISVPRLDPAVPKPEGGVSVPACGEPLIVPASFPQSIEAAIHKFANASSKATAITILDHYGKPGSSITFGKKENIYNKKCPCNSDFIAKSNHSFSFFKLNY
jgi:hypothetical protein